jgi:hypothetical protein
VATSANVTAAAGHLYLAAVSTKSHVNVASVSGLGLVWTRLVNQCGGRNQTGISVWKAQGTPSASGRVTATLSSTPESAVIAVARYSRVPATGAIGNVTSANSVRALGPCSGGTDATSYSLSLATGKARSLVYSAVALRSRTHTPGAGFAERVEFRSGTSGSAAGVAVMDKLAPVPATTSISGSFNTTHDWAAGAVEIRQ